MANDGLSRGESAQSRRAGDRADVLTAGITAAALLMVLLSGWTILRSVIPSMRGNFGNANNAILTVLLLNIALSLIGWRRFRDLKREVGLRRIAEGQAQQLATSDPLTGMLNRRALGDVGARLLAAAAQSDRAVAMVMIDLDHFKTVNDRHGHMAGDLLLRAAAGAISRPLPDDAIAARLGGDEFACAVPFDSRQPGVIEGIAEAILARFSQPFDIDGFQAHIGVSLGIARTDADCRSVDALMRRSDIALYAAKRGGRNRQMWFDATMELELAERNAIEQGLRLGIPKGEVIPYFEQQVDLATGTITGFEMLARWNRPRHGIVEPVLFIPIAEDCGLIGELSMRVMRSAMEEARDWHPSLLLAVNISPTQMRDPWLAQKVVKLLTETRFPPERLEIEITEASLFENLGVAQSIIGGLKNQGIRVALDDFGTGYSSLTHLRALPLDRIKIDRSFVTAMAGDRESAGIVATITSLADCLGVTVMAEGVENKMISDMLRAIGCQQGQGWHFGKPMSARQTRALLVARGLSGEEPLAAVTSELVSGRQDRRRQA